MTSVDALWDATPGVDVDAAVASAGTEGGRVQLELLMESLEIAAAQLLTVPGVAVEEPAELRRRLFERGQDLVARHRPGGSPPQASAGGRRGRSEEHTSELRSRGHLVCRLLLEKKKKKPEDESKDYNNATTTESQ